MTPLIQRIEAAKEPSAQLFGEVFWTLRGTWPGVINAPHPHYHEGVRFKAMLDAQAWTSAAEMLFHPREPSYDLDHQHAIQGGKWNALVGDADDWVVTGRGSAAHPSLALLAAILRAERKDDEPARA